WGLLDDQGVPKPCWHALTRVLQPVTVLITDEGMNGLYAHVLNEMAQPRRLKLQLRASRSGDVPIANAERELEVPARGAITVPCASLLDQFMDLNWSHRFGPPPCDLVRCTLRDETGVVMADARYFTAGHPPVDDAP